MATLKNLLFIIGLVAAVCLAWAICLVISEGVTADAWKLLSCSVLASVTIIITGWRVLRPAK